jgi:diacylglycerol kinase (ATP)
MAGIGIVTNPHSRQNRRHPNRMKRLGYVLGRDDVYEMTDAVEDVARVAEEFKKNEIEILALNGGDGTNHVTLTRFIEVYKDTPLPRIAFLRGGTMNTISNSIGITGRPGAILLNIVDKYYSKQPFDITERDMLKVTDDTGVRYGFIFGNGVAANFLELYYEDPNPSPAVAASLVARCLASAILQGPLIKQLFEPFDAEIELDGEVWPRRQYTGVLAATIEQVGLGFRPFTRCEERAGAFHVAAVQGNFTQVARSLPRVRLGQRVDEAIIADRVAERAVFRTDGEILYTIDGDMHRADGQVIVEAGPRLQIILG